ncbi:cell wall elongation/penicillin-binding protein regulator TseB [Bacillus atrophaeus]|uniref:cell wall elongation/penicillin-binding protein regulator TseB n=1 Tax=Bacillus atrophaeus TaxID=1452 RepID=UPI00227FAE70|nr:cell wall elongation/penicillin-binding protein regulator TseB [Bacillus atrophaeus]MCY8933407.1 cell wall elongation/penicillin-binding protein regulator TseB [Bacillus atrophaeus]MCY8941225.1 cell wall elongation/penicillin-binding protein regulator TseB [Bacillus atrophaeus]MCY8945831.1 cell wall elongation/penicillin-binding protein regulator TseB [Bacillus atrophaeus]
MRKKTLIFTAIFGIIFLAVLLVSASIFKSAMAQKEEGHEEAAASAKKETGLTEVDQVETFVGKEKYYIVKGTDKHDTVMYVWVPADKKAKIFSKKANEGITEQKAAKIIQDEGLVSKQKEVRLAREDNVLLWEVTYLDKEGQYSLSYVDFSSGKILKNITP